MTKISLKEASNTLQSTVAKFKTAQEVGNMSPEEVIEALEPIIEMAATIAEVGSEIQQSVPAENGGGINGIQGLGDNNGNNNSNPIGNNNGEEGNSEHNSILTDNEENQEEDKLRQQVSQLQAQIDEMKDDKEKEKLAQKYAQFYPVPMRESKIKDFMARDGSIAILTAQVQEAELNMGAQKAVRQAQIEEGTFDISNYDDNISTGNISLGGAY